MKKRKDGRFEKNFTVAGVRYTVYGKTRAEVNEKEREKRAAIDAGRPGKQSTVTFAAYCEEWLKRKAEYVRPITLYNYRSRLDNQILPTFGKKRVRDIDRRAVLNWYTDIKKDYSRGTAVMVLTIFYNIMDNARIDKIITENPAEDIKRPQKQEKDRKHRALTRPEIDAISEELNSRPEEKALFLFMLSTGIRHGEAAALLWKDIDRKAGVIHITKTRTIGADGGHSVGEPKTKTSRRDIPLTAESMSVLDTMRNGIFFFPDALVFPHTTNNYVFNMSLERARKRCADRGILIEPFTSHALRCTFATTFYAQTKDAQALKYIMGHSSFSMTMDLYAEQMPEDTREQMQKVKIIG